MGSTPKGISGSRAAAILGFSQYATPFSVWQEIMETMQPGFNAERGFTYEEFEGNNATDWGLAFEDAVVKLTQDAFNTTITHREAVYNLPDADYVTCHIDGKLNEFTRLFEGKTANHRAFDKQWGEPGTDRLPQIYQCQFQHNLMCTGLDEGIVSVLVFPDTVDSWTKQGWAAHHDQLKGNYFLSRQEPVHEFVDPLEWAKVFAQAGFFHQYQVKANNDVQKLLKEMYADFWHKYVLTKTPPEIVDYDDIKRMFTAPKGTLIIDENMNVGSENIADMMREYKNITKEIGASGFLAKRKIFLKNQILKFTLDKTTVADEESAEKVVFMDTAGHKLGSFNGKTFRS